MINQTFGLTKTGRTFLTTLFCLTFSWGMLSAATLVVDNLNDEGSGSFRSSLQEAVNGDTIHFEHHLAGAIALESPLPIITQNLTILGNGQILIDGQHRYPVLFIHTGIVVIRNLTIKNGLSQGGHGGNSFSGNGGGGLGAGGGLFVNNGAVVVLTDVNFRGNVAKGGNGGSLDTIYSRGAGGGGGGGMNDGHGGDGSFNFSTGSGGGGGGGLISIGGTGFAAGGGGGGISGTVGTLPIFGNGNNASATSGGDGGNGIDGDLTGGSGGLNNSPEINGAFGNPLVGGGGGGGGASTIGLNGGIGGFGGAICGGGGGGGGDIGGIGGNGGDFGGGGGAGGSTSPCALASDSAGGHGGFGGGGGGGSGCDHQVNFGSKGGNGGFGGGGGGGGKKSSGGTSLTQHSSGGGGHGGADNGGGGGGAGFGGAIFVREAGVLVLKNVTFCGNKTIGGLGFKGGTNGDVAGFDLYFVEIPGTGKHGDVMMNGSCLSPNLLKHDHEKMALACNCHQQLIKSTTEEDHLIIKQAALIGQTSHFAGVQASIDTLLEQLK